MGYRSVPVNPINDHMIIGQLLAALSSSDSQLKGNAIQWLLKIKGNELQGWQHSATANNVNFAVTGWVMYALAINSTQIPPDVIVYAIEQQDDTGWWPLVDVRGDTERTEVASTYATLWMIFSLYHISKNNLVVGEEQIKIRDSINRGTSWLLSTVDRNKVMWKLYPVSMNDREHLYNGYKYISMAVSSQVMYVLFRVLENSPLVKAYLKKWVNEISIDDLATGSKGIEEKWVPTMVGGERIWAFGHSPFPWVLLTVSSSIKAFTPQESLRSLRLIDRLLKISGNLNLFNDTPWFLSEVLIGIELSKNMIKTTPEDSETTNAIIENDVL